jgi:hypothetical protein
MSTSRQIGGVSFTAQALAFVLAVAVKELIANQRQAAMGPDTEVTIAIDIHLISPALLSQVAALVFGDRYGWRPVQDAKKCQWWLSTSSWRKSSAYCQRPEPACKTTHGGPFCRFRHSSGQPHHTGVK